MFSVEKSLSLIASKSSGLSTSSLTVSSCVLQLLSVALKLVAVRLRGRLGSGRVTGFSIGWLSVFEVGFS